MVGCTVRDALAFTIGRALFENEYNERMRIIVYIFDISLLGVLHTCIRLLYQPQKHQQSDLQGKGQGREVK